ncbi:MAG: hypothetical protein ACI4EQ_05825 [Lachnospiraceae bacterium]
MKNGIERRVCVDALETVSLRLGKLNNMILSLCLGMQQENLEQQAVDCVESIGYCVNDIRAIVLGRLQQIQELQNNMDKNNEHE